MGFHYEPQVLPAEDAELEKNTRSQDDPDDHNASKDQRRLYLKEIHILEAASDVNWKPRERGSSTDNNTLTRIKLEQSSGWSTARSTSRTSPN